MMNKILKLLVFLFLSSGACSQTIPCWTAKGRINLSFDKCENCAALDNIAYTDTVINEYYEKSFQVSCSCNGALIKYHVIFNDSSTVRDGSYFKIFKSGKSLAARYKLDTLTRIVYHFTRANGISITDSYEIRDGIFHGHFWQYRAGRISVDGYFKNCLRDSSWVFFYPNGKVSSEGSYYAKHITLSLSLNGFLYEIQNYTDTLSVAQNRYEFEKLLEKYNFESDPTKPMAFPKQIDFKDGVWKYYGPDGSLIKEEVYDKGLLIRTTSF